MADFSHYSIWYPHGDRKNVKPLHELVEEFKEDFLKNHVLQNVLLNQGYALDPEERPETYFDIADSIWHRSQVSIGLAVLETMIRIATEPQLVCPVYNISLDKEPIEFKTAHGLDAAKVEVLQQDWFAHTDITEKLRELQATLSKSFHEFNLKFILNTMAYAQGLFLESKEEKAIQERITQTWDSNAHRALDNAYYSMGNRFMAAASPIWQEIFSHPYGRLFVLSSEEMHEGVVQERKRLLENYCAKVERESK